MIGTNASSWLEIDVLAEMRVEQIAIPILHFRPPQVAASIELMASCARLPRIAAYAMKLNITLCYTTTPRRH